MKTEDVYYAAMLARDHRFDGKFFVAVKTTGIYCRPICPARPKRSNVVFFPNRLEAERAGYRPCLRCRPEVAPQSPAWMGKSAIVQRALKVIYSQETLHLREEELAGRFGVTARHLRRLFISEVGRTPKQLGAENRLLLAHRLLTETALPVADIVFAAGFRSVRRFNDAFRTRYKRSPTLVRRGRKCRAPGLTLRLPYRPPLDFSGLLKHYQAHQIGDLETFTGDSMRRVVSVGTQIGVIQISNNAKESCLNLEIDFPDPSRIHWIVSRVRCMFDLDSDPLRLNESFRTSSLARGLLRRYPGIRLPSGWNPFEIAVSTILGQLVSVERGRSLVDQLVRMVGVVAEVDGRKLNLFPTPEILANADLSELKTTAARKRCLRLFAQALLDRELSLEQTQCVDQFTQSVQNIPGIGPWTAEYMALKVLRHADAFPATDLVLAKAVQQHGNNVVETVAPWRGYLAALLWREYSDQRRKVERS